MASTAPATETLYGIINFDPAIECTKDTLGCITPVVIGGITGELKLPSPVDWGTEMPVDPLRMPLVAPSDAATWKTGDKPIFWGRPIQYPSGWSSIERALLVFELPHNQMREQATCVHKGFLRWYQLFQQYFELVTKQRMYAKVESGEYPNELDLFRWDANGKTERPYDTAPHLRTVFVSEDDQLLLKPTQFAEICVLASSSIAPKLHYRIQLEAYRAMRNGDYREAIIETGTAAELGLAQAANEKMSVSGITFADKLLQQFKALGGKLELARMIGVDLPSIDYKDRLVTPRNNVIHRGLFADRKMAFDAIAVTDKLLRAICPSLQES